MEDKELISVPPLAIVCSQQRAVIDIINQTTDLINTKYGGNEEFWMFAALECIFIKNKTMVAEKRMHANFRCIKDYTYICRLYTDLKKSLSGDYKEFEKFIQCLEFHFPLLTALQDKTAIIKLNEVCLDTSKMVKAFVSRWLDLMKDIKHAPTMTGLTEIASILEEVAILNSRSNQKKHSNIIEGDTNRHDDVGNDINKADTTQLRYNVEQFTIRCKKCNSDVQIHNNDVELSLTLHKHGKQEKAYFCDGSKLVHPQIDSALKKLLPFKSKEAIVGISSAVTRPIKNPLSTYPSDEGSYLQFLHYMNTVRRGRREPGTYRIADIRN